MQRFILFLLVLSSICHDVFPGKKLTVLFLGNSYTNVNDLPKIVSDIASSMGDTLIYDSNTPGGFSFQSHYNDVSSQQKMMQGGWDYLVMQEQSQKPSFPPVEVNSDFFRFGRNLNRFFKDHNPCANVMLFMTWGRKNGDALNCAGLPSWQYVCTYNGMDSLIRDRYMRLADSIDAELSPVGAVWRYLRNNYPAIELYQPDESHPSPAGSYAAACSFYTALFRKDPESIAFDNGIASADAAKIREAVKKVVYDNLTQWHVGAYKLDASFSYTSMDKQVDFTNLSLNALSYEWDFGDGNTSTDKNPVHTYAVYGNFTVTLTAYDQTENCSNTYYEQLPVSPTGISESTAKGPVFFPNPVKNRFILTTNNVQNIEIFNVEGEKVTSLNTGQKEYDVQHLPAGLYLLQIRSNKEILRYKLIKN